LQNHSAALPAFHHGQLPISLFNQRVAIFDPAQIQPLRCQRILPDAVGIRFALRPRHHRLGIAFSFGNFLGRFRLRGGQFVARVPLAGWLALSP